MYAIKFDGKGWCSHTDLLANWEKNMLELEILTQKMIKQ